MNLRHTRNAGTHLGICAHTTFDPRAPAWASSCSFKVQRVGAFARQHSSPCGRDILLQLRHLRRGELSELNRVCKMAATEQVFTAEYRIVSILLIFVVPALGGLLFGYDIGATAFVIQQLQSPVYSGVSWFGTVSSSPFLIGLIVAISAVGAFASSWMVFQLNDKIGRRQELRVGATLYVAGAAIAALSGVHVINMLHQPSAAIAFLILGRFIYGCGIGFTMHGVSGILYRISVDQYVKR